MSTPAPIMSGMKPPAALAIDKTIREDWRRWKREWTDYCVIQSVNVRPAPYQASLFRMTIGSDAMKVLDTQTVPLDADGNPASVDLVDTLIKMMDTFVMGKVNPTYERYLLRKRVQKLGESIETLITDLKTMVKVCEIPASFINDIIKDQIIFGIMDNAPRERLLQEKDLTLSKCIEMCKATEAASSHLKAMSSGNQDAATEISHIKRRPREGHARKAPKTSFGANHKPASSSSAAAAHPKCKFCGLNHPMLKSKCPAWGQKCGNVVNLVTSHGSVTLLDWQKSLVKCTTSLYRRMTTHPLTQIPWA